MKAPNEHQAGAQRSSRLQAGVQSSSLLRHATIFGATALAVLVAVGCHESDYDNGARHCDEVLRRCRTVCDYWCDGWGCYPTCYDQCWDECYVNPAPPPGVGVAPAPGADAAAPAAPPDAGEVAGGTRVLCSSCASNADCESGALCIFRGGRPSDASTSDGGAPSGKGFCGHACRSASECPQGFTCTQLGSSKQCLPNSGTCN